MGRLRVQALTRSALREKAGLCMRYPNDAGGREPGKGEKHLSVSTLSDLSPLRPEGCGVGEHGTGPASSPKVSPGECPEPIGSQRGLGFPEGQVVEPCSGGWSKTDAVLPRRVRVNRPKAVSPKNPHRFSSRVLLMYVQVGCAPPAGAHPPVVFSTVRGGKSPGKPCWVRLRRFRRNFRITVIQGCSTFKSHRSPPATFITQHSRAPDGPLPHAGPANEPERTSENVKRRAEI
jgi:hypothetical protein